MRLTRFALLILALTLPATFAPAQGPADKRPTWFIFLETGKKTPDDKQAVMKMQAGHIQNFKRLFGEKKLLAAGPLQDPSRKQRGIVVARADSKEELQGYFQPDDYVREGYMTVKAEPSLVHKPLNVSGIDTDAIEEVRIVQLFRSTNQPSASQQRESNAFLQTLVDNGTAGALYTLDSGDVAEVLFCRTTNTTALEASFAQSPLVKSSQASVAVWAQWLSKGVVK